MSQPVSCMYSLLHQSCIIYDLNASPVHQMRAPILPALMSRMLVPKCKQVACLLTCSAHVCRYLWLLMPGVLLFSIATVIFTSMARLLQSSKSSDIAQQPRVPSVDLRKVQEHVDRIQKARKVVCSGMGSG